MFSGTGTLTAIGSLSPRELQVLVSGEDSLIFADDLRKDFDLVGGTKGFGAGGAGLSLGFANLRGGPRHEPEAPGVHYRN